MRTGPYVAHRRRMPAGQDIHSDSLTWRVEFSRVGIGARSVRSRMVFTRRAPIGWLRFRVPVAVALVALSLAGAGLWLLAGTAPNLSRQHVVAGGYRSTRSTRRPPR